MAVPTDAATAANGAASTLEARVFVGGLPAEATERDLRDRFARFVADVASSVELELELLPTKAPWAPRSAHRGVAFLMLTGSGAGDARDKLVKTFNRTKWRGSVLRVEPARPHYLERLRQEWQAQSTRASTAATAAPASTTATGPSDKPMRVAVPFAGKRRKMFDEAVGGERLLDEYEAEQEEDIDDTGGSTSQDDESGDEEEENDSGTGSDDANDASSSGQEEEAGDSEEEEQEAIGEDDIEQFVRQMEAEASPVAVSAERSERATTRGDGEDDEAARAEANARRVAALEARQQLRQQKEEQQRLLVAAAVSTGTKSKKITFNDDGEAQEHHDDSDEEPTDRNSSGERLVTDWLDSDSEKEGDGEDEETVKAMDPEDRELLSLHSNSKKKSTLDFFTDKDDQERGDANKEEDSDVAKAFALRPEFLGESGKKLFEMQKRFGGDQRFRLDARFMEEDEFAAGNDDAVDDDEAMDEQVGEMQTFLDEDGRDDAAARELAWQAEQDTALAAIEKLFPDLDVAKIKHRLRVQATKDPIKEASWMGRMKRYDPRDANSRREFEISKEDATGQQSRANDDAEGDDAARRKTERENKPVLVGGDRFFATSNSLGSLFTRVRKNSEDGMEGEAALDGVFGFGNKADGDGNASADATEADGASTFKLSSLFDFPVEDEKKIASMGESLLEQDDEHEEDAHNEPWHFTQGFQDAEDAPEGEEDVETDGEGDDTAADDDTTKRKTKNKNKRSLEDFLAFGRTFLRSDSGDNDGKEWAERRNKLTLDFKRKRRDALKTKKKQQQQQFAKQKKPRRV